MEITMKLIIDELYKAYVHFNKHLFNNQLPVIIITIQTAGNRKTSMGWCTNDPIWTNKDSTIKQYEINISAEFLRIPFQETMDTLLHEMVHLYNNVNKIKDTSRGGTYHNKRFLESALSHGMIHPEEKCDKQYGYAFVCLSEETKQLIKHFAIREELFVIARLGEDPGEKEDEEGEEKKKEPNKKKTFRWVCPTCDLVIRSTKPDINVICGRCREKLECSDLID